MAIATDISDVSSDALNLKNMMDGILERVCTVFQSYNVQLPARRYWTLGTPAIDCDQVVVSFNGMYLGAPGSQVGEPQRCHMPRTATVTITIARGIPVVGQNGRPPSAEKIELASSVSAIDAWVLMESLNLFDQWNDGSYGLGVIATVDVAEPEGGFQIVNMDLTLAVP
jgi:hypothetical protein